MNFFNPNYVQVPENLQQVISKSSPISDQIITFDTSFILGNIIDTSIFSEESKGNYEKWGGEILDIQQRARIMRFLSLNFYNTFLSKTTLELYDSAIRVLTRKISELDKIHGPAGYKGLRTTLDSIISIHQSTKDTFSRRVLEKEYELDDEDFEIIDKVSSANSFTRLYVLSCILMNKKGTNVEILCSSPKLETDSIPTYFEQRPQIHTFDSLTIH